MLDISLDEWLFLVTSLSIGAVFFLLAVMTKPPTWEHDVEEVKHHYEVLPNLLYVPKYDQEKVSGACHYINHVFNDQPMVPSGGGTASEMYVFMKMCVYEKQRAKALAAEYFALLNMHDEYMSCRIVELVSFYPHAFKLSTVIEGNVVGD